MHPSKSGKSRGPRHGPEHGSEHVKGLNQAWSQLGRVRKGLRRVEHRIGDAAAESAGYPVSNTGTASTGPVGGTVLDQTYLVNAHSQPTARFVDAGPHHAGAKRKVSRLDNKYAEEPPVHRSSSAPGRSRHSRDRDGPVRGEGRSAKHTPTRGPSSSPSKRVDFSERLRLREVKWDGTYRDTLHSDASSAVLSAAPSTIHPPSLSAPPASVLHPTLNQHSTLTDPRAIRETEIRFLNEHAVTDSLARQERSEHRRARLAPRLTHVDVDVPGSSGAAGSVPSSSAPGRGGVSSSSASGRAGVTAATTSSSAPSSKGRAEEHVPSRAGDSVGGSRSVPSHGVPVPAPRSHTPPSSMSSDQGGGGDLGEEERGAVGGVGLDTVAVLSREEILRKQKIKKSLKDLPPDDDILAKLRDKIRQQRLSASSTDNSQNDSLASSLQFSDTSRGSTPQHMLHDDYDPVRLAGGDGAEGGVPDKKPRTRKVAAGPPTPAYRGFSEAHLDPHLQSTVDQVNRLHAPRRRNGSQKSSEPVKASGPASLQAHNSASAPEAPGSNSSTPEKPKKPTRRVASSKKPAKPGAKNIITASSWRAGQELIRRELGPAPKSRSKGQSSAAASAEDTRHGREEQRRPDGAEGNITNSTRMPATGADNSRPAPSGGDHTAQLAQSRALSEDAKKMLSDLQLENEDKEKHTSPARRPAVKRKAPKAEKESEKQQPQEKQRHYDSESVRQFMARQKAERQRRKEEEKKKEQEQQQKKQQVMQDLITKQKQAASTSKPKKVKRVGRGKQSQRVLFPASPSTEQAEAYNHRIRMLLGSESEKENDHDQPMDIENDESDADTLTGSSEEGSTPRATPVNVREDPRLAAPSTITVATDTDLNNRLLPASSLSHNAGFGLPSSSSAFIPQHTAMGPSSAQPNSLPTSLNHGGSLEFQGKKLNLDIDSVLTKFSQVVNQRRSQGAIVEGEFRSLPARVEGHHSVRSREERLQALKNSSQTLQSKLAVAESNLKTEVQAHRPATAASAGEDFVPRYERITGSQDAYSVFTSNLPGAQNIGSKVTDTDSVSEASPPPRLTTTGARTPNAKDNTSLPKLPGPSPSHLMDAGDDDSTLTETSTFSEITGADDWGGETPRHHNRPEATKNAGARQPAESPESNVQYTAPTSYKWENPCSDPYSVLNVFSRQFRGGTVNAREGAAKSNSSAQSEHTQVKDPVLMSTQQVLYGQTPEGHPIVAKTSYTRFEATIPDHSQGDRVSQASQLSVSARNRNSRSEERSVPRSLNSFAPVRARSASEDSKSLDSDEEAMTPKAVSSRQTSKKSAVASYRRQVSDTGQETDVSQLSEDEPRVSARHEGASRVQSEPQEEAKWSPAALEKQMLAELARLESLEDSLRQLSSADRTRAVALAQQETVSVAQVLKARQQAHSAELRSLQIQVQEERLASAQLLQQHLHSTGVQTSRLSETPSLVSREASKAVSSKQLLEQAENRRPESRSSSLSRSKNRDDTEYSESLSVSRGKSGSAKSVSRYGQSGSSGSRSSRTVASESVKTAEDTRNDSEPSVKTASDLSARPADDSIAEEVPDDNYSSSFEDSLTEEESFKQVLPSESHRKDAKRRKSDGHKTQHTDEASSLALGDLTSLFVGEDSFSRFTADMVRQIMREEELRAQHQAALLRLREKALKEKTKAELAWLQQQRQQLRDKGADDVHPQLARKEKKLLKQLEEQQAEIKHLQEANRLASKERQSLLKQHEQIARMQQETKEKMKSLQGRLGRPDEVHTEDEISLVDGNMSDISEDISVAKEAKSDSEVSSPPRKQRGEKQNLAKQQKLRLDEKYLTAREQRLLERKKQASELLKWKQDLDAEEEKVLQLERHALQAWEGRVPTQKGSEKKRELSKEETEKKVKAPGNLRPEPSAKSETVTTARDDSYLSTHISASEVTTDRKKSQTDKTETSSGSRGRAHSPPPSSSDVSIPEDISGKNERTPSQDRRLDSSDDTIVNSSVDEEMETPVRKGKKSPVGRLLPPGNSPLPQPWSRKTGSESESEAESVSHTETQSDVSDYEVRIRQLSDMLRRRRKEADMLKKERSRRQKDKLKAQEESLKKQLEAYENYIAQVKAEQADLEHEGGRPGVRPQIKQPRVVSPNKSMVSPSTSPGPQSRRSRDEGSNSDGTDSNQTSPALSEGHDAKVSPLADKDTKKKPSSLMDRISEGSESERSKRSREASGGRGSDQSVSEAIEEAVDESSGSSKSQSSGLLNIKTSLPSPADVNNQSLVDENQSYSMDFTDNLSRSHSKIPVSISERSRARDASVASLQGKSEAEVSEYIESAVSTAKSDSASAPRFDLKSTPNAARDVSAASVSTRPTTGIQESDSENESRINSHRSQSRPSSERSTGSTTYSDLHDFDEVEEDISSESERTPVKASVSQREPSASQKELSASKERPATAQSVRTDDDISEHISASLPSISEKRSVSGHLLLNQQDSLDAALGDLLGPPEEEETTPTETPRPESPLLGEEEALLKTDPLADFHEGDPVLVWGRLRGILRFKGTVDFAPGFWAGVELDSPRGDTDGEREGKRYFTCHHQHGVLVPGSEISPVEENGVVQEAVKSVVSEAIKSPDESLTDQDEVSSATEGDRSEPSRKSVSEKEGARTPVKEKSPQRERRNLDLLADDITADLTQTLVAESVDKMNSIATRHSPPKSTTKVPPPTLPKPKINLQQQLQQMAEKPSQEEPTPEKPSQEKRVENATSAVVTNLLDDAISKMMQIRRGRQEQTGKEVLHNGYSDDSGVDRSHDSSLDPALGQSPEPELGSSMEAKEMEDIRRPMSPEPFQRPRSPVPGGTALSAEERQELDQDLSGLLGDEPEFIDEDDFGLSKPPPPYPGAGDQASGAEQVVSQKSVDDSALYIVPHQRAEVEGIVADAVSIFWNLRRCGESWDSVAAPTSFLQDSGSGENGDGEAEPRDLVSGSRRIYKQLLFDLTGEIVRDIYQHENDEDPPPWQKPEPKRQRYFRGSVPPTTMDVLLPVVQSTVVDILGLNGSSGRFRGRSTNKWNIRKKKDHVDAVLVEELREEEADWINYDHDELAVKMQLTDTLFDSLLSDTVATLNRVYSRRQLRPQP